MHWTRSNTIHLEEMPKGERVPRARLLAVAGLALPLIFALLVVVFGSEAPHTASHPPAGTTVQAR